ncbi:MAG: helix-hairpin-helix domain-containing protein [Gemmatimonadaceae bacterium]|nr:helix-hairpin-helix domain-containing protein [Gemmatimonadaceae bacterium]
MPTPSEKKALAFLAAFALLGAGVRMQQAVGHASAADASSREALRRQIAATESAGAAERRKKRPARAARVIRGKPVTALDSAMTAPVTTAPSIFDPPKPEPKRKGKRASGPSAPVDMDRASADEIEALPRIGPALAKRIVEDRDANGPFGSIDELQRVRGVGPAMAAALASSVTFSGTPRPSIAGPGGRDQSTAAPRRRRHPAPP